MITEHMAKIEIDTGLSAVCAWCEHWHNGKGRRGMASCDVAGCGGPSVMRSFPMYTGPRYSDLHSFCFICGKEAEACVEMNGRMLGVCNRMGPENETCMDKLRNMLKRRRVIAKETVVPVVK
jgi:hypothetical protein